MSSKSSHTTRAAAAAPPCDGAPAPVAGERRSPRRSRRGRQPDRIVASHRPRRSDPTQPGRRPLVPVRVGRHSAGSVDATGRAASVDGLLPSRCRPLERSTVGIPSCRRHLVVFVVPVRGVEFGFTGAETARSPGRCGLTTEAAPPLRAVRSLASLVHEDLPNRLVRSLRSLTRPSRVRRAPGSAPSRATTPIRRSVRGSDRLARGPARAPSASHRLWRYEAAVHRAPGTVAALFSLTSSPSMTHPPGDGCIHTRSSDDAVAVFTGCRGECHGA